MKNFWLLGLLTFLGCTGDKDDSGDTGTEADADTDADADADADADPFSVDVAITASGVDVTTANTNPGYTWFGIAESGVDGWLGEDCNEGMAGYNFCHPFSSANLTLDVLTCVPDGTCVEADIAGLDAATETLFYSGLSTDWAWVLRNDAGDSCITGGDYKQYYIDLGCDDYDTM